MRLAALGLLAVIITPPLDAQDGSEPVAARTPENAQKFLEVAASRFGLFMEGQRSLTSGRFAPYKLRYGDLRISWDGKCRTRFDGSITEFFLKDDAGTVVASGTGISAAAIDALGQRYGRDWVKAAPFVIDWSTVTKVGVGTDYDPEKGTREVPETAFARSPTQSIILISSSDEIAGRLRLAMETLRLACDTTQELGF
jgi:hypothetical protein